MIDTDKYEGISEDRVWKQYSTGLLSDYVYDYNEADQNLVADAPLLLAEVKRLQNIINVFDEYMMNDFMTDMSRSEAHAIWNELVRSDV